LFEGGFEIIDDFPGENSGSGRFFLALKAFNDLNGWNVLNGLNWRLPSRPMGARRCRGWLVAVYDFFLTVCALKDAKRPLVFLLAGSKEIQPAHIAGAIQRRSLDRRQ
jgi:hypothetical protein